MISFQFFVCTDNSAVDDIKLKAFFIEAAAWKEAVN